MSTHISAIHGVIAALFAISLPSAVCFGLAAGAGAALLSLFRPLLRGVGRALVLVVKPKLSRQELLARRHMRDALMLNHMVKSMDGSAPSHAAELRALASRA